MGQSVEKHQYEAQAWQQRSQAEKATTKVVNLESDEIRGHERMELLFCGRKHFLLGMQFLLGMLKIQKIKDSDIFEH